MMKTIRLLFLSVGIFLYLILTSVNSSATDAGIKPTATSTESVPDVTDLEKPPNLEIPLKVNVVTEPEVATSQQNPPANTQPSQPEITPIDKSLDLKPVSNNATQKSLNLSVPFSTDSSTALPAGQNNAPQNLKSNIFAPNTTKKPQSIRLDGNVLMTQELEAEKRKTLDGAGITLNVKP
ncbi:MAG: hypothetical protein ABL903_11340 [Methylococcales bacterium]